MTETPEQTVQRQLDAYNARDVEAWLATYAVDAQQFEYPNTLLASGHSEIKNRILERFKEPNLQAKLLQRTIMGNMVIDFEDITRTFPEGTGHLEFIAIYEIANGKIFRASFVLGKKQLDAK